MAANIEVECPKCQRSFGLRFDPGPENFAPAAAAAQLRDECPDHDGKKWEFWHQGPPQAVEPGFEGGNRFWHT